MAWVSGLIAVYYRRKWLEDKEKGGLFREKGLLGWAGCGVVSGIGFNGVVREQCGGVMVRTYGS